MSPTEALSTLRASLPANPGNDGPLGVDSAALRAELDEPKVGVAPQRRHILIGDLGWLEYAIADYVAKWGEHFTGEPYLGEFGPNIAGIPTGVANMAMTVIRKNLVASWTEDVVVDLTPPSAPAPDTEGAAQ